MILYCEEIGFQHLNVLMLIYQYQRNLSFQTTVRRRNLAAAGRYPRSLPLVEMTGLFH